MTAPGGTPSSLPIGERATLAGILAFAAIQLGFELLLLKLTKYQYAWLSLGVIGIALLGVAGAALLVRLVGSPGRSIRFAALLCGPVALLTGSMLFDQNRFGFGRSTASDLVMPLLADGLPALALFALTSVPLFAALEQQAIPLARSYGSSFLGGALGTVFTLILLRLFGDIGAFCCLIALSAFGSAMLLRPRRLQAVGVIVPLALALVAKPLLSSLDRRSSPDSVFIRSDELSRIDVELVEESGRQHMRIRTGGINGATSTTGVPNRGEGNPLEANMRHIPFALEPRKVLILGSGAGPEVVDGLRSGCRTIYAVEIISMIPAFMRRALPAEQNPYLDPAVRLFVGEGREIAARLRHDPLERKSFDLVYVPIAINVAASGQVFSYTHLITKEALAEYADLLAPGGMVSVLFPNVRNARAKIVGAMEEALPRADATAEQRMAVLERDEFFSLMARADGPLSAAERQRFEEVPVGARSVDVSQELRTAAALKPLTDDNPFFFNDTRERSAGPIRFYDWNVPLIRYLVTLAAIALLVVWALMLSTAPPAERLVRSGLIGYFAAIGAAYVVYQTAVLQRLSFLTGHPTMATAVVLTATLAASGLGSLLSERALGVVAPGRRAIAGLALLVWIVLVALAEPRWLMAGGWSMPARLAVAALVAMPPFIVMGTYFPIGLKLAERQTAGLLPWCWAANGVASILGSSLLLLISMRAGVAVAVGDAGFLYAAVAAFDLAASRSAAAMRVAGVVLVAVLLASIGVAIAAAG